jgi:hypothetical protein
MKLSKKYSEITIDQNENSAIKWKIVHEPKKFRVSIIDCTNEKSYPLDLICIDTRNQVEGSIKAIEECLKHFPFKRVKLVTNRDIGYKYQHLIPHDTIRSISDYSKFCVYDLWKYIEGTHCLIVQYDGYILNANAWTDEWLNLDYIGANNGAGGNGGFSLRSKKFCKYVADFYIKNQSN